MPIGQSEIVDMVHFGFDRMAGRVAHRRKVIAGLKG
jgi:hypothetical protein